MEPKRIEVINATCPECRGPLTAVCVGDLCEYHCLIGHVYTARTLLEAHSETEERTLYAAVVALLETADLVERTGSQFSPEIRRRLRNQAEIKRKQAEQIRLVVEALETFQLE
jgi:two-component system chemotaxis response regulator CheB